MTIDDPQVAASVYNLPANMRLAAIDEAIQSFQRTQVAASVYNLPANMPPAAIDEAIQSIQRTQDLRDRVLERLPLTRQEVAHAFPQDVDEAVFISPKAYLRSVIAVVWSAFRHPFSTTYIDLSTGDYVTPVEIVDETQS